MDLRQLVSDVSGGKMEAVDKYFKAPLFLTFSAFISAMNIWMGRLSYFRELDNARWKDWTYVSARLKQIWMDISASYLSQQRTEFLKNHIMEVAWYASEWIYCSLVEESKHYKLTNVSYFVSDLLINSK